MIVTLVDIHVKKDKISEFIEATRENHRNSITETGNLRFDFLQNTNDESHFILYEAYESEEAAAEHKKTEHYLKWRAVVESFMERPRIGTPTRVIEPSDPDSWRY